MVLRCVRAGHGWSGAADILRHGQWRTEGDGEHQQCLSHRGAPMPGGERRLDRGFGSPREGRRWTMNPD
jgi:hypothetical protein